MSFWDGVASFGLGAKGYDEYTDGRADRDYLTKQRARADDVATIELERLHRQDDLARTTRDIARKYGIGGENQLPERSIEVPFGQPANDDEGNPMPPPATKTQTVAAQQNTQGLYQALADAHMKAGNLEQAEKIRKAMKEVESEGYGEIVKGVVAGEDPQAIAQRFNQRGNKRIVSGEKAGDAYAFTYEDGTKSTMNQRQASDLGTKLGIFKKDMTIIPEGGTAIDGAGNVIAHGGPKSRNIDPLSPEGLAATQKRDEAKARAAAMFGKDVTPARVKEVKFLAERAFGGDETAAIEYVYGNRDKSRTDQILKIAGLLKADPELGMDSKKLMRQAEDLVDGLRSRDVATRGGKAPATGRSPAPGGDVQADIEAAARADAAPAAAQPPAGYPDAQRAPDGKWYVKKADGWYLVR